MTDGTTIKAVDYLDGFQYAGSVLQFFPHSEGYVKATPATPNNTGYYYNYVYNYTDHLGNIRLSYTKDPLDGTLQILEENHYYPFGLRHEVYVSGTKLDFSRNPGDGIEPEPGLPPVLDYVTRMEYQYKYNGKEWQDELDLNVYAYGWRDYDPATARFSKIDRFAEKYPNITPYNYAANNPLRFTDVKGDSLWITFGKENEHRVLYENGNLLNSDGSTYTGEGVKVKKNGKIKIKNSFLKRAVNSLNDINNTETGGNMLATLQDSDYNFRVTNASFNPNDRKGKNEFVPDNANAYFFNALGNTRASSRLTGIGSGGTIYWNPTDASMGTLNVVGGTEFNPITNLGHELGHGWDANFGLLNTSYQQINGLNTREWRASDIENQIRGQMGYPLRSTYNGVNLLDSRNNPLRVNGTGNPTVDYFINIYSVFK